MREQSGDSEQNHWCKTCFVMNYHFDGKRWVIYDYP
jgi:hypothetical protein